MRAHLFRVSESQHIVALIFCAIQVHLLTYLLTSQSSEHWWRNNRSNVLFQLFFFSRHMAADGETIPDDI